MVWGCNSSMSFCANGTRVYIVQVCTRRFAEWAEIMDKLV